ncbi:DNA polymerase III subunit delta [Candidatus Uhrbacteria bacterium]|nr:DNA polymerase III subunit delta [Candidatus Uhrbacteria bacterium]
MLIFVYGDDSFRVSEKVKQMKEAFRVKFDPTGLNTAEFPSRDTTKLDVGEVMGAVRSLPFLGQKRMVVVHGLIEGTKKPDMDAWEKGFLGAPDSTIVIFWETVSPKELEKKPLFVALKGAAEVHVYPFPELEGVALSRWVADRIKARGGSMQTQALQSLVERVGGDLWAMDHEISKLVAFASGAEITQKIVDELVGRSYEEKIFELMDAISQKRTAQAIRMLQEERLAGSDDHYLLTMLGRQVRILLGARALLDENPRATKQDLADVLSIHPFVAQKALAQVKGFSLSHLKAVHDLLFDFDRRLKSGHVSADIAVDLTAVKMMT